jgi:hypothetical protein
MIMDAKTIIATSTIPIRPPFEMWKVTVPLCPNPEPVTPAVLAGLPFPVPVAVPLAVANRAVVRIVVKAPFLIVLVTVPVLGA